MSTILDQIIAHKRIEVEELKQKRPLSTLQVLAEEHSEPLDFGCALLPYSEAPIRIIAECKKQSPSKGILIEEYFPSVIARRYECGGAAAISVLTDEKYFGGHLDDLVAVKESTGLPVIRKDFIIDEYQIYEARAAGADSFLLLSGVLDLAEIQYFIEIGRDLGMEPLVESHNLEELEVALSTDAKILGINNRNLSDFSVDLENSKKLYLKARSKGQDRILVCESAITGITDIKTMAKIGFRAFLVGEALITKSDHERAVRELRSYHP